MDNVCSSFNLPSNISVPFLHVIFLVLIFLLSFNLHVKSDLFVCVWSDSSCAVMPWGWFWLNPPMQRDVLTQPAKSSMMETTSTVPLEVRRPWQNLLREGAITTQVPLWKPCLPHRTQVSAVVQLQPMKGLIESVHLEFQPRCLHSKLKT